MKYQVSVLFTVIASALAWDDVILPPPAGKTGPSAVVYFGQGAEIKTSQYSSILADLQESVDFPLWIGVPQCPANVAAIPGGLKKGIERVEKAMIEQGMTDSADFTFYGGHSLGGAMMPDVVADNFSESASGMFLLGSFITRKYKTGVTAEGRPQVEYPVPTLTVGGELDGLCRISRITEALYTQITFSEDPKAATDFMPVTVVEGMNHMQFASGEAPSFVANNDIKSDIEEADAHKLVVADISNFMKAIVGSSDALKTIQSRVAESTKFVQPITDALLMEGYEQFLPGCYCEEHDEYDGLQFGTCESTPACNGGVKWTNEYSQPIMAGLTEPEVEGLNIESTDSIHLVTETNPSAHLPHIHGGLPERENNMNPGVEPTPPLCEKPNGCTLPITTVTQHVYDNSGEVDLWRLHFSVPWIDTGFLPITANELKTKMKSRQSVWQAAGAQNVSFVETDTAIEAGGDEDLCMNINQAAIDWAFAQLPAKTAERYTKYGQKLMVGEDIGTCAAGPCWIWDALRFKKDDDANTVNIQSVWFGTENTNKFPCGEGKLLPCSSGFHYCKLLSPARALEWMYVDGLKNVHGLNK